VPADVLAQLGNRVQHALRALTPDDAAALRATARTFPNSDYDIEELLTARAARVKADAAASAAADAARDEAEKAAAAAKKDADRKRSAPRSGAGGALDSLLKSAGTTFGREITRTVFGTRRR